MLDTYGVVQGNWVGWSTSVAAQIHSVIQAHIHPSSLVITDVGLLSETDGDGILEPGESAELALILENIGDETYTSVNGLLSTDSEWITITVAAADYPGFAPGEQHANLTPFQLTVDAGAPPLFDADLHLALLADGTEHETAAVLSIGQLTEYYRVDVESGIGDWTHGSTGDWNDEWHISTQDSQSLTHSWKCGATGAGDYGNHLDSRLTTEPIQLLPYSRLAFRQRIDCELSTAFPDSAYDGAILEISTDGINWVQLTTALSGGYNKFFRWESGGGNPATHPFPGGTICWSGSYNWLETVFDLTAYGEATVQFRFRFGSDNGTGAGGWFIDDVVLMGYDIGPGDPLVITISYSEPNVVVTWDEQPAATGYKVYHSSEPYGPFELVQDGTLNSYTTSEAGPFFYYVTWY